MKWRYFDIIISLTIDVVIRIFKFIKSNARNCTIINYQFLNTTRFEKHRWINNEMVKDEC